MRILIWHGYLLDGTGSNVYTRSLARTWSQQGHEVVVLCQDPDPDRYDLGGAQIVRPRLDGPLPVFVLDDYADADPVRLPEMDREDRDRFVEVNAREIRRQLPADLLLTNHALLGAPVGAEAGMSYVVKVHGSELEFAIRGHADLAGWANDKLGSARAVLAGSDHIVHVLEEVVGPGDYTSRVEIVPPGVDTRALRPEDRETAFTSLLRECALDPPNPLRDHDERLPDPDNAERLGAFLAEEAPTVLYVGKLSEEKGVSLLLEALEPIEARAIIVGFGPSRQELEAMSGPDVLFTGPLEHRHLAHLWPLSDVAVTPSVFPEAFGMVAAEAASCGCPPLVAGHSGLAEIAARIEAAYPVEHRHLAAFELGDVSDLRAKLMELLTLPRERWLELSEAARQTAVREWSWGSIADRIVAVASQ